MKAKAAVFMGAHNDFEVREFEVTKCPSGYGRMELIASGICGTDLHFHNGKLQVGYPSVIGHEFVGKITDLDAEEGKKYGLTLLPENCVCTNSTPLKNLQNALTRYPFSVTADTRASAFHGETNETLDALLPDSVGHFHIIDYEGAPGDWTARKAIRQPGEGGIDWDAFFARLKKHSYNGTLTLESSNILPDTVDYATFNKSVEFIRNGLK